LLAWRCLAGWLVGCLAELAGRQSLLYGWAWCLAVFDGWLGLQTGWIDFVTGCSCWLAWPARWLAARLSLLAIWLAAWGLCGCLGLHFDELIELAGWLFFLACWTWWLSVLAG
jgi:hypothetical protein